MKRKLTALAKGKDSYTNKRITRSMNMCSQVNLTVSNLQPHKKEYEIQHEQDLLYLQSERSTSTSTSTSYSHSESTNETISEEARTDANILIKMEEVKESLKDGVDVLPGSTNNSDRFCQICSKEYSTDKVFDNHLKYVHDPKYKLARKLVQNSNVVPDENNPDFHCRVCIRTFSCGSSFRGHLTNVHKMRLKPPARTLQKSLIKRFADVKPDPDDPNSNCCVCQKNFSGKYNFRRHLRQVHKMKLKNLSGTEIVNPNAIPDPNDPNNYCNACERRFSEKSGYLSHIEVVHCVAPVRRQRARTSDELPDENDPNNYCKVCKKTLGSKRSYRSHLRSIHVMQLIPTTDRYKRMLNAGKVPDPNDPNNYCLVCEKTFGRNDSFRVHLKTIHNIVLVSRAPGRFNKTPIAHPDITPDEDNPDFHCQACERTFRSKTMYRRHLRQIHKMSLKPLLSSTIKESGLLPDRDDPNFYCHPCDLKHRTKKEFLKHLCENHSSDIDPDKPTILPDIDDPNFYCHVCDKTLKDGNLYRKHLRHSHKMILKPKRDIKFVPISHKKVDLLPEIDDPNYFCRVCEKTYESQNSYRKHLRTSHRMKLVPLTVLRIANKELEEEAELRKPLEHLEICGICGKGFTDSNIYQHHCVGVATSINRNYNQEEHIKSVVVIIPDENDPNFYCNLCQTNSPDRHTFHNHLEFTHKMKLVNRSKEPTFEQVSPEDLPDIHDPNHYCKVCDKTYTSRDNYYGHIRLKHNVKIGKVYRAHPIPHPELAPDVDNPNLFCCACEKTFVCKSAYRHHLTTIHNMKLKSSKAFRVKGKLICDRPDLKPDPKDPNFFCCSCQRSYASRTTYHDHLVKVHKMNPYWRRRKNGRSSSKKTDDKEAKKCKSTKTLPEGSCVARKQRLTRSSLLTPRVSK